MKHLAILAPLLLAGCVSGTSILTQNQDFIKSLAEDKNTAAICLGPIQPYFGGFSWARKSPDAKDDAKCPNGAEVSVVQSAADTATAVVKALIDNGIIAKPAAAAPPKP